MANGNIQIFGRGNFTGFGTVPPELEGITRFDPSKPSVRVGGSGGFGDRGTFSTLSMPPGSFSGVTPDVRARLVEEGAIPPRDEGGGLLDQGTGSPQLDEVNRQIGEIEASHAARVQERDDILQRAVRGNVPENHVQRFLKERGLEKVPARPDIPEWLQKARVDALKEEDIKEPGAPTFTKIEGEAFSLFVNQGPQALNEQQTAIVQKKLADPLFAQATRIIMDDALLKFETAEVRSEAIFDLFKKMKKAASGTSFLPGGGTGGPGPEDAPDPAQHKGQTATDPDTGQKFRSNGVTWEPVQ